MPRRAQPIENSERRPVIWLRPYIKRAGSQPEFGNRLGPYQATRTREGALDVQTSDGEWATLFYMTVATTWTATSLLTDLSYVRHWTGILIDTEETPWPEQK